MENLDNKFIELFEDLYDKMYMVQKEEDKADLEIVRAKEYEKLKAKEPKSFFERFKTKTKKVVEDNFGDIDTPEVRLSNSYDLVKTYLNDILSNPSQTFWTLWKVCQFLRWAEKVFLYNNDPEKDLFIDSGMNDDERCIAFTFENTFFKIKLQLVKKPEIKLTESAYNEVVTILIQRQYGKKMENKYISVDGYTELVDDSDIYTINQVNRFLNIKLKESFNSILTKILNVSSRNNLLDLNCTVDEILNPIPQYN